MLGDYERLLEGEVPSLNECGQLGSWNREMVPNVTGMRVEFVQATGYELAMNVVRLSPIFILYPLVTWGCESPGSGYITQGCVFSRSFRCFAFAIAGS